MFVLTEAADACEGLWDVGEPKDVNVMSNINVAANAPQGRWKGQDPGIHSRLPVVCKTVACVLGAVYRNQCSVTLCGVFPQYLFSLSVCLSLSFYSLSLPVSLSLSLSLCLCDFEGVRRLTRF